MGIRRSVCLSNSDIFLFSYPWFKLVMAGSTQRLSIVYDVSQFRVFLARLDVVGVCSLNALAITRALNA